jgi:hypothetical protein
MVCLREASLTDVRKGTEQGVDIGNYPGTSKTDVNGMVFVDGPYTTEAKAAASAQSLQGTELSAAGGRYVVSATLRSHLGAQVDRVATCLTQNAAPKHTASKTSKHRYAF